MVWGVVGTNYDKQRERMVRRQMENRDIRDPRVLAAMRRVPRHEFVPQDVRGQAYDDGPLLIGENQTISQPYIVAFMSQALELGETDRVLEVGTGSGYQTAVLCELARQVYSLERHASLAATAGATLARLGYANVEIRVGDGSQGWPEHAPYDAIIVTAAAPHVPEPLLAQLADGGRLVLPVVEGDSMRSQMLLRITRVGDEYPVTPLIPVVFVPLIGRQGFEPHTDIGDGGLL
ncbi:MAG: protein-L-isoaspartate(D-aspartate) O-methyltransferase [Anaerolineae bacterium]|nr:protein-L-isoaspartate(D-aspartate) O-methyltransferase [Anaerolineae bacterium]